MPKEGFVNMLLPKRKVSDQPTVEVAERERYPYGMSITLGTDALKKLGYSAQDFKVGGKVVVSAKATIESLRISENPKARNDSVELQITDFKFVDKHAGQVTTLKKAKKSLIGNPCPGKKGY